MKTLRLKKNARGLVLVAHPDDETIWCGGLFLKYPDVKWTVLSLCRRSDPDRRPKYFNVMKHYGAQALIADLKDEGVMTVKKSLPAIKKIIQNNLQNKKFDYLFCHNLNGEYGHPRHVGAHLAVKELAQNNKLPSKNIYFFSYKTNRAGKVLNNLSGASHYLNLTDAEWRQKKAIIHELYGFSKKSFEFLSCLKKETFTTPLPSYFETVEECF